MWICRSLRQRPGHPQPSGKDYSCLAAARWSRRLKYLSIEHNINLMNKFYDQEAFAGLFWKLPGAKAVEKPQDLYIDLQ